MLNPRSSVREWGGSKGYLWLNLVAIILGIVVVPTGLGAR